ncbi:uncharacterized protein JCM10292_006878 [Rhodotorula paludigena]|uniref:uncharacterized protein n=1 Tax=Rhodotorula paludigena TaxID=86838 RepID=UPI003175208F
MPTIPKYVNSLEDLPDNNSLAEWFPSMIGPPTLALLQGKVAHMLERLEHSYSELSSAAAASAKYPYTDDQEIKKYNLNFSFASQTCFITFMSSPERIKLLQLVKPT